MIVKVQILQRRLIAKTEQVAEKDLMLAEKERLYTDLKAVLARHPGPEVAEQLSEYRVWCFVCCCVLLCIVLLCIVLLCIVLLCIVLLCIVLLCIVLLCIVLLCIVLYVQVQQCPHPTGCAA